MNTDFDALSLSDVLDLNRLNRNTYNTLVRREGLPFMSRDLLSETGHRRFRLAHSVAVAAFLWLRRSVIAIPDAAPEIDKHWSFVRSTTDEVLSAGFAQGWLVFTLWADQPWEARAEKDLTAPAQPLEGRDWNDLEGTVRVPIWRFATEQADALPALRARGQRPEPQ